MGRVLSGAGSPQNPGSTRSLRRERIQQVGHFLSAPTGLKETVNASHLPLPEKVPQEEEMALREEVRPPAKSPKAVVESGEGGAEPRSRRPPKGHPRVDTEADMASPRSEADGLLRGQSFRKEGERRLAAAPGPRPGAPKCRTLNPACLSTGMGLCLRLQVPGFQGQGES